MIQTTPSNISISWEERRAMQWRKCATFISRLILGIWFMTFRFKHCARTFAPCHWESTAHSTQCRVNILCILMSKNPSLIFSYVCLHHPFLRFLRCEIHLSQELCQHIEVWTKVSPFLDNNNNAEISIRILARVFLGVQLTIVNTGSGNGVVPNRRQAITWNNVDRTFWLHMTSLSCNELTHWGWVTHICVGEQTIIGSHIGLSPGRRQAIIWTNAGKLSTGPLGTNVIEILIENAFWKMAAILPRPQWVNSTNSSTYQ